MRQGLDLIKILVVTPGQLIARNLPVALKYGVVFGCLYFIPNWITFSRAEFLPLLVWEHQIPFLVDSVWPYISLYVMLAITVLQEVDPIKLRQFLKAMLAKLFVGAMVFLSFPTKYPRPESLPESWFSFSQLAAKVCHQIDTPANCCPSLHISACLMCVYLIYSSRQRWFPGFLIWFLLIAISTLTFKQHYVWDILAGFILGGAGIFLFRQLYSTDKKISAS